VTADADPENGASISAVENQQRLTGVTIDARRPTARMSGMGSGGQSGTGPLPPELLAAVESALEREHGEADAEKRARMQTGIRAAVEGWQRGRVSTAQAVLLLRIASQE
jgi:hypothetical protein